MSPGRVEQGPPRERGLVQKADGYADYAEAGNGDGSGQYPPPGPPGPPGGRGPSGDRRGGELAGPVPRRAPAGTPPSRRRPRRQRSIRSTITLLLITPLVTLAILLVFTFFKTVPGAVADHNNSTVNNAIGGPLQGLLTQLDAESSDTYLLGTLQTTLKAAASMSPAQKEQMALLAPSELKKKEAQLQQAQQEVKAQQAQLKAQRPKTDAAIAAFRAGQAKLNGTGAEPAQTAPFIATLMTQLGTVPALRAQADSGMPDPLAVFKGYQSVVSSIFGYVGTSGNRNSTIPMFGQAMGTVFMGQALADVATEATLGGGALESGGVVTKPVYQLFVQTVEQQRQLEQTATVLLEFKNTAQNDGYIRALNAPQFKNFQALENKVIDNGPNSMLPASMQAWQQQVQSALGLLTIGETQERTTVTADAQHNSDVTYEQLYGIGGGATLLVLISSLLLFRFGGRVSRELRGLRAVARNLAFQRLPSVVDRLRVGEDLDPATEAPPLYLGTKTREVTETAEAFSEVQRTAVQAAIEQAMLRKAVSNVFRRLARRNQGLLQRQLKMLDEMERGTQDPDALGQLFRLDHLTTRMRRQAEGLIILSGAAPGRSWRKPVPVVEVLRGAISEIEDYVRVDLLTDSPDYLQGAGVADVTHLLAELIENAVTYSPPSTRVRVSGGRVANGYVVEIEDRGLGISPEALSVLNQRLAEPPEFDVADSDQLGLFVVSRLADKQGIRVSLRQSNYGGTTAIVLLPTSLVVSQDEAAYLAAQETAGHSNPGFGNGNGGGRGRVAAAMGAAADALSGKWRSRTDTGGFPAVGRNSGPMPAAPGGSGLPTRAEQVYASGPLPVRGGSAGGGRSNTGGFPGMPGGGLGTPDAAPGASNGGGSSGGGHDGAGLPRRQRMANMAPQLREQRPDLPRGPLPGKSPEQARALLSNIQRGLRSGRNAPVGDNNGNGTNGGETR